MKHEAKFPCLVFKVDLSGGFGQCKCGFTQPDHKPEKRKQLKEKYLKGDVVEEEGLEDLEEDLNDLEELEDLADEACDKYQFDPSKPYNTCGCGFTKKDHEVAKVKREKEKQKESKSKEQKLNTKSPRELAIAEGVPCPTFEVDIVSKHGLGMCLCGLSRRDHQDFSSSPSLWIKKKKELTEPKAFI